MKYAGISSRLISSPPKTTKGIRICRDSDCRAIGSSFGRPIGRGKIVRGSIKREPVGQRSPATNDAWNLPRMQVIESNASHVNARRPSVSSDNTHVSQDRKRRQERSEKNSFSPERHAYAGTGTCLSAGNNTNPFGRSENEENQATNVISMKTGIKDTTGIAKPSTSGLSWVAKRTRLLTIGPRARATSTFFANAETTYLHRSDGAQKETEET